MGVLNMPDMSEEGIPQGFAEADPGPMYQPPSPLPMQMQPMQQQAPQGFLDRMGQFTQDNSGMLMAAAAGIGKGTSMGNMFGAIQEHQQYQDGLKAKKEAMDYARKQKSDQLEESKRLNSAKIDNYTAQALKNGTAKVTNMGNGFMAVVAPGQTAPTMIANEDYQAFANQTVDRKGTWGLYAAGAKADAQPMSAAQEAAAKDAREAAEASSNALENYRGVAELLNQKGAPELAGLPLIAQLNQILGTDDAATMNRLGELKIDQTFRGMPRGQGAMSNMEREILKSPLPTDYANTELWKRFVATKIKILEKAHAYNESELEKVTNRPRNGLAVARQVASELGTTPNPAAVAVPPGDTSGSPSVAPVTPAPAKAMQAYPPGFKPPSNGRAPKEDQLAILQGERATEAAKPASAQRDANLAALDREIAAASGGKAKAAAPAAAPTRPPLTAFKKG